MHIPLLVNLMWAERWLKIPLILQAQTGKFLMCSCSACPAGPGIRILQGNCWVGRGSKVERESDLAEKKQGMSWRWGAHPQSKERGTEMPQIHGFNQKKKKCSCAQIHGFNYKKKGVPVLKCVDVTKKKCSCAQNNGFNPSSFSCAQIHGFNPSGCCCAQTQSWWRFPQGIWEWILNSLNCSDSTWFSRESWWLFWGTAGAAGTPCKDQGSSVCAGN